MADVDAMPVDTTAAACRRRAAELAGWAMGSVNRTDCWGAYLPLAARTDGKKSFTAPANPGRRADGSVTVAILKRHFLAAAAEHVIGLHAIGPDNTCRWAAWDIDRHTDAADPNTNRKLAVGLYRSLVQLGFHPLLTESDDKGGFHLRVLFAQPVPSTMAFAFARWVVRDAADIESFPKQAELSAGVPYGNWLRLPGRHHTRDVWARVFSGTCWTDGDDAVDTILAVTGDDPGLIPLDAHPAPPAPPSAPTMRPTSDVPADRAVRRCLAYLDKLPPSVSGEHGHDRLLQAACETLRFGLGDVDALAALRDFNRRSSPPWDDAELARKLAVAHAKVNGDFGCRLRDDGAGHVTAHRATGGKVPVEHKHAEQDGGAHGLIFNPDDPRPIARRFTSDRYSHPDGPTLLNDGDVFHQWGGTRYAELPDAAVRAEVYAYLESAKRLVGSGDAERLVPFAPNRSRVDNVMDAARSLTYTGRGRPAWLSDAAGLPNPDRVLAATNGLVHLRPDATAERFGPPTPLFYSLNAIDYPFDANAPAANAWLTFLNSVWPDDQQAVDTLQEWFGYCLTADTRQQKALLLVGPKRGGKGTIARVLSKLVGQANVCGPTLAGMGTTFGLWPLLGKLVAIVSDARLSGRTDQAVIIERILAVTGEDSITVDRKNREPVTVRVPARLMILTNELPRLADASGALAGRFIVLMLRESFYGKEDTSLERRITAELPSILLWAIEGWRRLQIRGRFEQPSSSADAVEELNDLASPTSAFVREWCAVRPGLSVPVADIFDAWGLWCREQGNEHAGTQQVFGRDLRASVAGLGLIRTKEQGVRTRTYSGIDLTLAAKETLRVSRDQAAERGRGAYGH